jgi:calmodulin
MGLNPTDAEITQVFQFVDSNSDGSIDFPEFLNLMEHTSNKNNNNDLLEAFREFDIDGSGQISRSELKKTMSKLGPNLSLSEEQLDDVLREMDENGNGEVSYEEFAAFMSKK